VIAIATTDFKLSSASQIEEAPILAHVVASGAVLCTDGSASLRCAARQAGIALLDTTTCSNTSESAVVWAKGDKSVRLKDEGLTL